MIGKTTRHRTGFVVSFCTERGKNTKADSGFFIQFMYQKTERNHLIRDQITTVVINAGFRAITGLHCRIGPHTIKLTGNIQVSKTKTCLGALKAAHTRRVEENNGSIIGNSSTAGKCPASAFGGLFVNFIAGSLNTGTEKRSGGNGKRKTGNVFDHKDYPVDKPEMP